MLMESLTNAKNQLSRLIERVRKGERVRILVNGVPAADLVPVGEYDAFPSSDALGLAALEKEGVIRRGAGVISSSLLEPGPAAKGTPLTTLLREERDER
jgi:prevent-host-death family protein